MSGLRAAVSSQRRADLDELTYRLRAEGMTLQAIADRLGVTLAMARRRVIRHERLMRERQKAD